MSGKLDEMFQKGAGAFSVARVSVSVAVILLTFAYTVALRSPFFGVLSEGHHQWLSGSTLHFAQNWLENGVLNENLLMYENPDGIEFQSQAERGVYPSYPAGAVLFFYSYCRLTGQPATAPVLMQWCLINHLLIAALIWFTVTWLVGRLSYHRTTAFTVGLLSGMAYLLLPGPLYWHQNVYFADQAVILPFASLVCLEVVRRDVSKRKQALLDVLASIIMAAGVFTDWLFVFVCAAIPLARLVDATDRQAARRIVQRVALMAAAPVSALGFFVWQVHAFGLFDMVLNKALYRTGVSQEGAEFLDNFVGQFYWVMMTRQIAKGCVIWIVFLVLVGLALLVRKVASRWRANPNSDTALHISLLVTLPCVLQTRVLANHSVLHDFSILKFSYLFAILALPLTMALIPIGAQWARASTKMGWRRRFRGALATQTAGSLVLAFAFLGFVAYSHMKWERLFPKPEFFFQSIGSFVRSHTSYTDVVFSPHFEVNAYPPQLLAHTRKRVYRVLNLEALEQRARHLDQEARIVLVSLRNHDDTLEQFGSLELWGEAHAMSDNSEYEMWKLTRTEFLDGLTSPVR